MQDKTWVNAATWRALLSWVLETLLAGDICPCWWGWGVLGKLQLLLLLFPFDPLWSCCRQVPPELFFETSFACPSWEDRFEEKGVSFFSPIDVILFRSPSLFFFLPCRLLVAWPDVPGVFGEDPVECCWQSALWSKISPFYVLSSWFLVYVDGKANYTINEEGLLGHGSIWMRWISSSTATGHAAPRLMGLAASRAE